MDISTNFPDLRASATPLEARGPEQVGATFRILDPLDHDRSDDEVVVTTRRALHRVALVATETAARFQREGLPYDSMSWMLAPRRLFGGAAAIDACLDREACLRGILVHGLSLGLDVDPETIDALAADDDNDDGDADIGHLGGGGVLAGRGGDDGCAEKTRRISDARVSPGSRLFTATLVAEDGLETVHLFHASMATDEAEFADRLYYRIGGVCAGAVIIEGFDPGDPLVDALVSNAIADTLAQVAADPLSPLANGLDLNVEQRFHG